MSIRGYTDLAISTVQEDTRAFRYLNEISKSVKTASELSGQMLAYSGRGNFVVETTHLNDIIEEMKPMLYVSVSRKVDLEFILGRDLPSVKVDGTQMGQVILNLVANASEAIGTSTGKITLRTGLEKPVLSGNSDTAEKESSCVFIQVDDTGSGMSDKVISKLFEPFFTTKFTGRGLGMAVVQGIVEGHNGFITVSSELGVGSSLKVLIPISEESASGSESDGGSEIRSLERTPVGILLVDDEKNILFVGKYTLEKAGYTVFTAGDGERAVEVYRSNKDVIQCVILDLTMPIMDGVECLRELKKCDPAVRVILSSGYNQQEVESRIHLREIVGYLKKPYGLGVLIAEVKKALRNRC
jgi:CheY-like chemotaxis protein